VAVWSRWPVFENVLVNLHGGTAIEGVLIDKRGPLLVLANATLHDPAADHPQPMDGQVFIERDQVQFIQRRG
jgi:small nuclear ribonucleoprotein (snRNP)-like protein